MPVKNDSIIIRNDLIRLFDGLSGERIVYVCAPAGYGKTVAVRQWLDSDTRTKAVISLDEYDNNPIHFCKRFCAALCVCQPKNTSLDDLISHPAFGSAPEEFAARAIAALSKSGRSALAIDDLYFITEERVLRFMLFLLSQLPQNFQIVFINRHDPPGAFSELADNGNFVKVTAEHFLFSKEEVALLYKKRGNYITPEQAEGICRFTNGWAIGVGALLLSGGKPSGEGPGLLDQYIRQHVWERWDREIREFMLRTAAARQLSPSLCTALTGVTNSEELLGELIRGGAFIVRQGDGTYRYHHLFREFLKNILAERGEGYVLSLLEIEGGWHLSRRDFYNAAECYIRCGSHDGIAKCFSLLVTSGHEYFHVEKMLSVAHQSVIDEAAKGFPYIYSTLSWAAFNEGNAEDMARYADLYYQNQHKIVELDPRLQLNIELVRLIDFRLTLRDLIQAQRGAAADFTADDFNSMGVSIGIINQNMPFLHRGTRDFSECAAGDAVSNIQHTKAVLGGLFGDTATLFAECLIAGLLYEQGDLETAHIHALSANAEIEKHFAPESKFCAMAVLIEILDALGKTKESEHIISNLSGMIEQDRAYYLNYNFRAMLVRRKLLKSDTKAAREWISAYGTALYEDVSLHGIYTTFTSCRAYITAGDCDSAIILLTKAAKLASAYNRPLDIIEAKILLAIAYWNKRFCSKEEAMSHFEDAVSLAYGFRYTQIFIHNGEDLYEMVLRLQKNAEQRGSEDMAYDEDRAYIDFIIILASKIIERKKVSPAAGRHDPLTYYTDKQKIVMKLLIEGKNYKEITEIMGIKLPTLRSHISLIYKKLDAMSETDAILKIKSSGILDG